MEGLIMNLEELKKLKDTYNKAVKAKEDIFIFQGKEMVVGFAKYLIQFLESDKTLK